MRNLTRAAGVLASVTLLLVAISTSTMAQSGVPVAGVVTNNAGMPVPGVAVSLIHPLYGRSSPSFTDQFGRYAIWNVPPHPAPYFLEIYWGRQLIYRQQIIVSAPLHWNAMVR